MRRFKHGKSEWLLEPLTPKVWDQRGEEEKTSGLLVAAARPVLPAASHNTAKMPAGGVEEAPLVFLAPATMILLFITGSPGEAETQQSLHLVGRTSFSEPFYSKPSRQTNYPEHHLFFFLPSCLRDTVRVSCACFREGPLEVPLFPIGGNIYIHEAGRSPSTALPCFSSSFFIIIIIICSNDFKRRWCLIYPPTSTSQNTFFNSNSSPPHTFPPTHKAQAQVSVCEVGSLERAFSPGAEHISSQQRAVSHKAFQNAASHDAPV